MPSQTTVLKILEFLEILGFFFEKISKQFLAPIIIIIYFASFIVNLVQADLIEPNYNVSWF